MQAISPLQMRTGSGPPQTASTDRTGPAPQAVSVLPDFDLAQEKRETDALERQQKPEGDTDTGFHSEALEKLLEKVTQALEKELAPSEASDEARSQEEDIGIGGKQLKSLGLIIQKYAGKDLSFTEWSGLYQELQTEGFDISKPLLDVLL